MHRLFVALRPPPAIRAALLGTMGGVPGARWQDDEQLHLTLRFIGEVDGPQADDIAAALGQVHAPAPAVARAGGGRVAQRGRPEAGGAAGAPAAPLAALHRKVDAACVRAGVAPEGRAFVPHITLARIPRSAGAGAEVERWLADHAGLASAPFTCAHVVLYESRLGHAGASYEAVERWPLG